MSEGLLLQILQVEKNLFVYLIQKMIACVPVMEIISHISAILYQQFFFLIIISVNIKIFAMFLE